MQTIKPPKKRVYIAYTGGTIGMVKGAQGYEPQAGYLAEQLEQILAFHHPDLPDFVVHEYPTLLDSSQMNPQNWNIIAQDIATNLNEFDGFVILHGTDTMAYTASALSFMFNGLQKPIILTGSQVPLSEARSDAVHNIVSSMVLAATTSIAEVGVYFNRQLFRGNRVTKVSADEFDAFDSPNCPPLAELGVDIDIAPHTYHIYHGGYKLNQSTTLQHLQDISVGALRIFPGMRPQFLENALQAPLQGLVLETYGAGNAPNNPEFLKVLQAATARDVLIVNCTQCLHGSVTRDYAAGHALYDIGIIPGYDMTPEAALCKLLYLLSCELPKTSIVQALQSNLRGELTLE